MLCAPGAPLDGYYFVTLEGDGAASPGVANVSSIWRTRLRRERHRPHQGGGGGAGAVAANDRRPTDALDTGSSALGNAHAFVVIQSPDERIVQGADYDPLDDGTLDLPAGAAVVDGVALFDPNSSTPGRSYAPRLTQTSGTSDAATRVLGDTTPLSGDAWYAADLVGDAQSLEYDPTKASANFPPGGVLLTPGAPNAAPGDVEPAGGDAGDSGGAPNGEKPNEGKTNEGRARPPASAPNEGEKASPEPRRSDGSAPIAPTTIGSPPGCATARRPSSEGLPSLHALAIGLLALAVRRRH